MIIDSPIISGSYAATGSLNQVGNVVITGSLTVTEQITGSINSASLAQASISASFAQSAATASYLSNYIPPFPYTGSAGISGSLSVNGDITSSGAIVAQTLYVQTITSSVDFVTGSTRFGSELSNTHLFTGSVTITGSLAVNGSTAVLTNQTGAMSVATASYVANAVSASFAQTAISASYASNVPATASFAVSASQAENATSASYITGSNVIGTVASATSASFAQTAISASYASNVPATASFAVSASQAQNAVSAAYSAYALTSSYSLAGSGFPFSGSAVITGSLLITNLSSSGVSYLVADSTGFITAQTASAAIKTTQTFTASSGQTTFTIANGYTTGLVDVFVNGTKLNSSEFTDTNGTTIVLATGSFVDDIVEFSKYLPASGVTNNTLRQLTTFTASAGQTVFSASYTPGLLDIYYNGSHLSNGDFTANNGTFITLATGSAEGDILDVFVYTYQVGAFSGIGGAGVANEISYFNTTNSITSSAAITISGTNAVITGSLLGTASYAANANLLDGLDSSVFVPTGSFNTFSSSLLSYTGSANSRFSALETTSGSNITRIAALEVTSGSNITRISALESASGSAITRLGALEVTSGSNITRISALESASGSAITRLSSLESKTGSYATTGSNIFVEGQYLSSSYNPTGFSTTASLYTDGGLRVTKDAYISGTLYLNNVTVYGTQSVCYITSSQLNISSNLISVNTATPSVRFGGLAVYDSGSTGLTGSILWDSEANHWIYSNPSGSSYSGGMFISGPRTTELGSETGTTACMLLIGQGGDHLTSSMIYHDSTVTCIPNTLIGSTICTTMANASCIGIGTATPSTKLNIRSDAADDGILLEKSDGTDIARLFYDGTSTNARLDMFCGGSTKVQIHTNGTSHFSGGNVGIGTNSPQKRLDVLTTVNSCSEFQLSLRNGQGSNNVSSGLGFGFNSTAADPDYLSSITSIITNRTTRAADLIFSTAPTGTLAERMRITSAGNVGIGTNSPVAAANYIFATTNGTNGSGYITQVNGTTSMYAYSISTESRISEQRNLPLVFETCGTERMRITSGGDAYIRNTTAAGVNSQSLPGALYLEGYGWNTSAGSENIQGRINLAGAYDSSSGSTEPSLVFSLKGSGGGNVVPAGPSTLTERMRITNAGYVGIGTNCPQEKLTIDGTSCGAFIRINNASAGDITSGFRIYNGNNLDTEIYTNPTFGNTTFLTRENLAIRAGGSQRVLISCTGIACFQNTVCVPRLQVFNTSSIIVVEGTATNGEGTVTIAGKNSSGTSRSAVFKYDNADIIRISTADAIPMRFETSDVTRLTIASTGVSTFTCQVCAPNFLAGTRTLIYGGGIYDNATNGNNIGIGFGSTGILPVDGNGNLANGTKDLGSASARWCTVYTSDLSLNNGIGNYTIVEGENDLFLYNNNSCKVFKFLLQEVCPEIAPAKRST